VCSSDLKEEGLEKTLAQNDLNYKKELAQITRQKEDLLDKIREQHSDLKELPEEPVAVKVFEDMEEDAKSKFVSNNKEAYKSVLEEYRTFAQKRIAIEEEYQKTVKELRKAGAAEENIQVAQIKKDNALDALDEEMAQKEQTFKALMMRIGNMSLRELEKALQEAEKALRESEVTNGDNSRESGVLRVQIKKLKEEIATLRLEKEIDDSDEAKTWEKTSDAIGKCKKEVDGIIGSMDFLDETTKSALNAASNIADGTMVMLDGIKKLSSEAAKSISAAEKASIILAIIAAAWKIINSIFSAVLDEQEKRDKAMARNREEAIAFQRQYNLLLLEQNLLMRESASIFGKNQIEGAYKAVNAYLDALSQLKEAHKNAPAISEAEIGTGAGLYGEHREAYYGNLLREITNPDGSLNIDFVRVILETRTLSDETRNYLQNLVDLNDKANEASESLRDYLQETFGSLGEGLMDSIVSSIQDSGINAWEAFGDAGARVIENLGKQLAYQVFFATKFKKLQEDLGAVYDDYDDPEEIANRQMAVIGDFYQNIGNDMDLAQKMMEGWQAKAAEYGFDVWGGDSEREASQKGFAAMSQDSAGYYSISPASKAIRNIASAW
jgi:hypothetical protein